MTSAARRRCLAVAAATLAALLAGCAPQVGSNRWCKDMDAKPKGDWSANDVADYAKHCVLGLKPSK